jgi:hypothetical protein
MGSNLFESVIVIEFHATEAHSSLDLTKAKYGFSRLSKAKKKMLSCELALVILVHVKKINRHDDENEACSQYAHPNPYCNLLPI